MNILILNQYALPRGAAGITRHGDLGSVLVSKGHKVTVIASGFDYLTREIDRTQGKLILQETHSGVDFFWLKTTPYKSNETKRTKSMVDYSINTAIKGLNLADKPDVVIASSPHLLTGLVGIFLSAYYQIPFVFEIRDLWPYVLVQLGAIKPNSFFHKTLNKIEKIIYKKSAKIIILSHFAGNYLKQIAVEKEKISYIPNGIFLNEKFKLAQNTLPDSLKSIIKAEKARKIIMYCGAHGIANNLNNVLEALDYLRNNKENIYNKIAVFFIGGGQQKDHLIKLAHQKKHSHVHFHPPVAKAVVKSALSYADILLVHVADGFNYGISPNKLYDYLDAEKPILYSSAISNDIIEEIRAGITFLPNQPRELARAIETMIFFPEEERVSMAKRGKSYVREYHNLEKLGEKLEKILLEVISKEKR